MLIIYYYINICRSFYMGVMYIEIYEYISTSNYLYVPVMPM